MAAISDSEILCEMICDRATLPLLGAKGHRSLEINEPKFPTSKVYVRDVPDDAFVLNVDAMPEMGKVVFIGTHCECKRADYVIICPEKCVVVFIELKNRSDTEWHRVAQLKGADCIYEYCKCVGKLFWDKPDFLSRLQKHYVSFIHTSSLRKRGTRKKSVLGDGKSPSTMRKIAYAPTIFFNEMIEN